MKKLIKIILILSCICSFSSDNKTVDNTSEQNTNPLDSIHGEKIIDKKTGAVQKDNFLELKNISRENLDAPSILYNVESVGEDFYVLNQNKSYYNIRLFSVVLKVKDQKVEDYFEKNDFKIIDQLKDENGITVLFGNFENYSKHWKTNNEVQLIRLDNELNQVWSYSPKSTKFPLEALEVKNDKTFTRVEINVITSCHICTNRFELKIDNQGNCFSAVEIDRQNSSISLDEETVEDIFRIH